MARVHDSIVIDAPIDKVYAVARDPHRWATWRVNLVRAHKVKGDGSPGTVVECDYLVAGCPVRLRCRVLDDWFAADGSAHSRVAVEGGIRGQQLWDYQPVDGGAATRVTADIDHELPDSVLGKGADRELVELMEAQAVRHALEDLKLLAER